MAVVLATVKKLVAAAINVADTYGGTIDGGSRAYDAGLSDAILAVDAQVCNAIMMNPTHGRRKDFLSVVTVAHGGSIPTHVGPPDSVLIGGKGATVASAEQIEKERELVALGVPVTPHFNLDGNALLHNGASTASLGICTFTLTAACQSPDEMLGAVVRGTIAMVANVEGEDPALAQEYDGQFKTDLQMIGAGEMPPMFVLPQREQ